MRRVITALMVVAAVVACAPKGGSTTETTADKAAEAPKSYRFKNVTPPAQASYEDRLRYMQEHFWDKFDFADTLFVQRADTTEMLQVYGAFTQIIGVDNAAAVADLMHKASTSRKMFDYFVYLAETVTHDPNSPMRNDELYIPVLQAQVAAPFYDKYERMAPEYDLQIALKNRVGHKANNFTYTLADGKRGTLYGLQAEYILIFINNPDCSMCKSIREAISASPMLTELIENGTLKVLAIYPDEDLTAWRNYAHNMPVTWINSYDKGCVIDKQRLYDLKAIPSMYLLDAHKTVLVKDSTEVEQIEYVIDHRL